MPDTVAHYDLLEKLGAGGMGTVWRAYDRRSGDIVALKVLHPYLAADEDGVKRFQREAAIAGSIESPYVVRVLDWGNDNDSYYLAMEYVPGPTLADMIRIKGKLPFDDVVSIAGGVARALDAAHAHGVIHRDIKPQNVIVTADGRPKVADFGVSWAMGQATMTMTGMYVGTPAYMAPDLVGKRRVDIRADIYSLGVVMYEMLTGSVPFSAATPLDVIRLHEYQAPPPIETIRLDTPSWLADVCECCLAKSPADRFQTPTEVLSAIEQAEDFVYPLEVRVAPSGVATRTNRTLILASATVIAASLAVLLVAGLLMLTRGRTGSEVLGQSPPSPIEDNEAKAPVEPAPAANDEPASLPPAPAPEPEPSEFANDGLPDRTDCNAIRGTPYRSGSEYSWFWTNCGAGSAPSSSSTSSSVVAPRASSAGPNTVPAGGGSATAPANQVAPGAPPIPVVNVAPLGAPAPAANSAPPLSIAPASGPFALPANIAGAYSINAATRAGFDDNASLKAFFTSTTGVAIGADGTLHVNGINGWSSYFGYGVGFKPGEGVMLFFAYDSVAQANIMLQTASSVAQFNTDGYRRFGISMNKFSPRVDLWQGKQGLGGNPSLWKGGWTPQAGKWYGLLLGVTPDGQFQAYVWDKANPGSVLEYAEPVGDKWKTTEWRFLAQANNGLVLIDDVARVTIR